MTYQPQTDFFLEVAMGSIPGHTLHTVRGHNPTQTSASGDVDVSEFGDLTYLSSAETMNIVSTTTNDDGSPVGTGARTVLVEGVSSTGAAISEVVTMNGTTNVLTSLSYLRVNTLTVVTVGSVEFNDGDITATASAAATVQCQMNAGQSISQNSHFTVPLAKTSFIMQVELNAAVITGPLSPVVEFKGFARVTAANSPWVQLFAKRLDTGVTDELDVVAPFPIALPARTDARFVTNTDTNGTESRIRTYFVLVDD